MHAPHLRLILFMSYDVSLEIIYACASLRLKTQANSVPTILLLQARFCRVSVNLVLNIHKYRRELKLHQDTELWTPYRSYPHWNLWIFNIKLRLTRYVRYRERSAWMWHFIPLTCRGWLILPTTKYESLFGSQVALNWDSHLPVSLKCL